MSKPNFRNGRSILAHVAVGLDVQKQSCPQPSYYIYFPKSIRPKQSIHEYPQALQSLERAAQDLFGHQGSEANRMRTRWACEWDRSCRDVLKHTHQICVFRDVMEFAPHKKTLYCATHDRQCPCTVLKAKQRNLEVTLECFIRSNIY